MLKQKQTHTQIKEEHNGTRKMASNNFWRKIGYQDLPRLMFKNKYMLCYTSISSPRQGSYVDISATSGDKKVSIVQKSLVTEHPA